MACAAFVCSRRRDVLGRALRCGAVVGRARREVCFFFSALRSMHGSGPRGAESWPKLNWSKLKLNWSKLKRLKLAEEIEAN